MSESWESVLQALKRYWGYDSFRPPQDQIVKGLISGRDLVVVLPTGYGKSLCFQLPALLQTGVTLVVSPLVALMEDQVRELRQRGLSAGALHGEVSRGERQMLLRSLEQNRLRLLYLSPETLLSPTIWERLRHPQVQITGLMIDEAHTLVHWGESFRPDFRRLGAVRGALAKSFALAAFTATADPYTEKILTQVLQLHQPQVVRIDPRRSNLRLNVRIVWSVGGRRRQMLQFIRHNAGGSGLVYVRTRQAARQISQWLAQQGERAIPYHGGLGAAQRRQLEGQWLAGDCPFLVCTNAFGLGINKPDVRWVLHYQPPMSVADYIQEVGRGGRDGQSATGLLLASEPTGWLDPSDRQQQDFFRAQRQQLYRQAAQLAQTLPMEGTYGEELIQTHGAAVKVALALLHQAGCLQWIDPFHFRLSHRPGPLRPQGLDPLYTDPSLAMEQVITTRGCRWQTVLRAFGYPPGDRCGVCDNCLRARSQA